MSRPSASCLLIGLYHWYPLRESHSAGWCWGVPKGELSSSKSGDDIVAFSSFRTLATGGGGGGRGLRTADGKMIGGVTRFWLEVPVSEGAAGRVALGAGVGGRAGGGGSGSWLLFRTR